MASAPHLRMLLPGPMGRARMGSSGSIRVGPSRRITSLRSLVLFQCLVLVCGPGSPWVGRGLAAPREAVDLLVSGGTVVPMDSERRIIEDGAIAVRGDTILATGPRAALARRYAPARRI